MESMQVFNEISSEYSQFRPSYPKALFQYLAEISEKRQLALDVGTGNGQSAHQLAHYFDQVVATDLNQNQLMLAPLKANILYELCPSEKTNLLPNSVDLITCAQSLHYFDLENFYQEVRRVATKNAHIAAWCYHLPKISPHIDPYIHQFHYEILQDFWPPERRHVDTEYQTIPFTFERINTSSFSIQQRYSLEQFIGFLTSWVAVKEYQKLKKQDPLNLIYQELKSSWGPQKDYTVYWQIYLLLGKC